MAAGRGNGAVRLHNVNDHVRPALSMSLAEHITWHLDAQTFGGVVYERLLAAIVQADGLYSGLVFTFTSAGRPVVEFWERIDDLERQGFRPIGEGKARALCDALPRFLDHLEQAATRSSAQDRGRG